MRIQGPQLYFLCIQTVLCDSAPTLLTESALEVIERTFVLLLSELHE